MNLRHTAGRLALPLSALAAALVLAAPAQAQQVKVTVTNLAPDQGVNVTPVWLGFHDGSFDTFNQGQAASASLERLAEDGNTAPLSGDFSAAGFTQQTTLASPSGIPPFAPGQSNSYVFNLDPMASANRYLSFAAMVVPSNDAFIGNDNPTAHAVFAADGSFLAQDFVVMGSSVWDAGTEVNDEIPANTALLGQMAPNTGTTENGVVSVHPGFIPGGNILTAYPNADFTQAGYQVLRVQVSAVPEPATFATLLVGLGLMGVVARRTRSATRIG